MIDTAHLLFLFERLITWDSPSFGERAIGDDIKALLTEVGITVEEDNAGAAIGGNCGNLYARIDGGLDLPPILFCAHLDTVEPSRGKKMRLHEDGKITSDGTTVLGADNCAGLASILEALLTLRASGLPHRPIELLFTVAEEPYCRGVLEFDCTRLQSREAYIFDLTGPVGGAAYQAPAILSFEAVFTGRAAHAGFAPEDGIHAIGAAALAVSRIPRGRVSGSISESTVNVGTMAGGVANNIVPDRCRVTGEIRSYSNEQANLQLEEIAAICRQSAAELGASVEVQGTVHFAAYRTDLAHPVVRRFEAACGQMGLTTALCQTFGGSDNNYLSQQGIHGIVVATAMNNCHSCSEYTTVQELERAARLAYHLMTAKE